MEKPFDWKKSGVFAWKAGFPTMPAARVRRALPALPPPAAAADAGDAKSGKKFGKPLGPI